MLTFPPNKEARQYLKGTVLGLAPGTIVFAIDDGTGNSKPMSMEIEQARRWSHFKDHVLAIGQDVVIRANKRPHRSGYYWDGFIGVQA